MPRVSRKNLISNYFHVMVQGLNKEYIFDSDNKKIKYLNLIKENLQSMGDNAPNVLSYCLMDNHTHFLFHVQKFENLSSFMHQINMHYSMYYNKLNDRVGYVFRDRFKVQEINDTKQLYNCLRYIHNNPVKAKMCNSMSDYKFSSYNEFLGSYEIITPKSVELLFGTSKNYINIFQEVHQTFTSEDFLDVKEVSLEDFTRDFTSENNTTIKELVNDKHMLSNNIKKAKREADCALVDISNLLNISQNKVGYYYRKNQ